MRQRITEMVESMSAVLGTVGFIEGGFVAEQMMFGCFKAKAVSPRTQALITPKLFSRVFSEDEAYHFFEVGHFLDNNSVPWIRIIFKKYGWDKVTLDLLHLEANATVSYNELHGIRAFSRPVIDRAAGGRHVLLAGRTKSTEPSVSEVHRVSDLLPTLKPTFFRPAPSSQLFTAEQRDQKRARGRASSPVKHDYLRRSDSPVMPCQRFASLELKPSPVAAKKPLPSRRPSLGGEVVIPVLMTPDLR